MSEDHVDGNALGALLHDIFGREMTEESGCCANCGAVNPLGTMIVYRRAPGEVMRCVACSTVLAVAVSTPAGVRLTFEALRWVQVSELTST